ncbi:GTPase Era [Legionella massiliensis]|uniref:GTPase Era n=1 Tax=Legionella massiliensis TaxID=1034943 RepID=A0A078KXQ2_9GAMM|nr:GTP-binding protein [Legionella massiliensis]CDZ76498.1 GTPase Era [Legionella massiliensis]CEE12236.1 GTPase Era [Legionella massiliensis]
MTIKVAFLGKEASGKTQLINKIVYKNKARFEEISRPSVGPDFLVRNQEPPKGKSSKNNEMKLFQLWDFPGVERFEKLSEPFLRDCQLGVFCIDLTTDIDDVYIQEKIKLFRQYNPDSPIILVGTKADAQNANVTRYNQLQENKVFAASVITSAKAGVNTEELFSLLGDKFPKPSVYAEARARLLTELKDVSQEKKNLINLQLETLEQHISAPRTEPQTKANTINAFSSNCEAILDGEKSGLLRAVAAVAAAAFVTVVAGSIGFGIGFALSWWTGPGAFFAAITTGYAAASVVATSVSLGALAGGLTAYGLFKTSKEMEAINEFTTQLSDENTVSHSV